MRLKDLRVDKDLYQKDIADLLGIDQRQYSRYEIGKYEMPYNMIIKLAMYYNTSVDYILGVTDEKKPYTKSKVISDNNYCVNKCKLVMSSIDITFLYILIMLIY